jgi:hypothetical protein
MTDVGLNHLNAICNANFGGVAGRHAAKGSLQFHAHQPQVRKAAR